MTKISALLVLTLVGAFASGQVIKPAVINSSPVPYVDGASVQISPTMQTGAVTPPTGQPIVYRNLARKPAQSSGGTSDAASQIQNLITQMMAHGRGANSDTVPPDTDWRTYEYPDNFKFYYGGQGVKNIGDGLCTGKNVERSQVKSNYCEILSDVLTRNDTCASRELTQIINKPIGQLDEFCPSFHNIKEDFNKRMVYVQILASLITLESGWNASAVEPGWTKPTGERMQGKGLFQIGTWDTAQDPDCAGVGTDAGIKNPTNNIKCGACIALKNLSKDSTIGKGSTDKPCESGGSCGMARYFGPMRDGQRSKREAMKGAVSNWCTASVGATSRDAFGGAAGGIPGSGNSDSTR